MSFRLGMHFTGYYFMMHVQYIELYINIHIYEHFLKKRSVTHNIKEKPKIQSRTFLFQLPTTKTLQLCNVVRNASFLRKKVISAASLL